MARDRKAEAARRDAKARAEGFTSYGQKYRAEKAGFKAGGKAWNSRLDARRQGGFAKSKGTVKLSGYAQSKAGAVLSARRDDPQAMADLQRAINQYGPRRRAQVTFQPDSGQARNYARHGGVEIDDLSDLDAYLDSADGDFYGDTTSGGYVTVVIA